MPKNSEKRGEIPPKKWEILGYFMEGFVHWVGSLVGVDCVRLTKDALCGTTEIVIVAVAA